MPVLGAVEILQDQQAQMASSPMVPCLVRFVGQTVVQAAVSCSLTHNKNTGLCLQGISQAEMGNFEVEGQEITGTPQLNALDMGSTFQLAVPGETEVETMLPRALAASPVPGAFLPPCTVPSPASDWETFPSPHS